MQSKRYSLIEAVSNTIVGFLVSILVQLIVYPVMDIPVSLSQNIVITFIFTVVSILRGYALRRFFNLIRK